MTAPVTQTQSDGEWVVQFTMPGGYSLETLPEPSDPKVKLRTVAAARFAVIRFSGLVSRARVKPRRLSSSTSLRRAICGPSWVPPQLAQYNPPWTPWFMRRNEVMIEVQR